MTGNQKKMEEIQRFWNDQAREHATDLAAVSPDPLAKELELEALCRALDSRLDTIEIGCGNGYNLFALSNSFSGRLVGVDYAEEMIGAARLGLPGATKPERFEFHVGSVLHDLGFLGQFQQAFTDRCLINLPSLELQIQALDNISRVVQPGGHIALIESTQQGQERINELRECVGLNAIPYHWHNLYLDEDAFLAQVPPSLEHVSTDNFASLYFVISRVLNAKLTPRDQEPDYLSEMNKVARALPSIGDHGPLKLFLFRKIR